jgi:ketosteroid isomerase-like protein
MNFNQQAPILSDADREQLTHLEERLWREQTRFDMQFMEATLADDFFEFGRSGRTYTRETTIGMAAEPIHAVLPLPNLRIRLLDESTAQVTYDSAVRYDGAIGHGHRSSIWSKTERGWVLRFHQGTPYRPAQDTISRWHRIVQDRDPRGLASLLADDVVFHSPVVHTPQVGKALVIQYLAAALQVFGNDTFRYEREIVGDGQAVLEFGVEIEGIAVNGVDMISWDALGRIVAFKVMVRPLKAINLIHQKMAALLQTAR